MPGRLRFGRFELRPDERRLVADGQPVQLGPRAFSLLLCLVERRDRVVPKRELVEAVWPGIDIDEGNLTVQASALRRLLGADALITIAGQGYRFALPVTAVDDDAPVGATEETGAPALAVLPFEVTDGDARLRLLAEALAEDTIALLARVPGLLVVARDSSFQFAGCTAADAAGQLGVRYVAEATVAGVEVVSVTARVSDASTGFVLWTGRLQAPSGKLADLHPELARQIAAPLRPGVQPALEPVKRARPDDPGAWDSYRVALAALEQGGWSEPALRKALVSLQHAASVDPGFALARAHHALLQAIVRQLGLDASLAGAPEAIADRAELAADDDPGSSQVLGIAGSALVALREWDRARPLLAQAIAIDPSNALAHAASGLDLCRAGEVERGLAQLHHAIRISPRDRRLGVWSWMVGTVLLRIGRAAEALDAARTAVRRDPRLGFARLLEAAALVTLGEPEEALVSLLLARQLQPHLTLDAIAPVHGSAVRDALAPLWPRADASAAP